MVNDVQLKAKYKESFIFFITAPLHYGKEVEELGRQLSPSACKIFQISETHKYFELPKKEVKIAAVTQAMLSAKSKFSIHACALTRPSLQDILTKVASNNIAEDQSDSGEGTLVSAALSPFVDHLFLTSFSSPFLVLILFYFSKLYSPNSMTVSGMTT